MFMISSSLHLVRLFEECLTNGTVNLRCIEWKRKKILKFNPDVLKIFIDIVNKNIVGMQELNNSISKNQNSTKVTVHSNNAMTLESIENNFYDLIITSPPYGDSRTTVAYGEYSRLALQWLDLPNTTQESILKIDKTLMGGDKTDKISYVKSLHSNSLNSSLDLIFSCDSNRANEVANFYADLYESIKTLSEKSADDGYQFWVVGNRTVKGVILPTDDIIAEFAQQFNMEHVCTINRTILNKVMPSKNSPDNKKDVTGNTMTKEHIVVLHKI